MSKQKEKDYLFTVMRKITVDPLSDAMTEARRLWQEETANNPELNQGLEVGGIRRREKERFAAIAQGFIESGIIAELSPKACKVLWALASLTNKQRNTQAGNRKISERAGLSLDGVKSALRELEYYHMIVRTTLGSESIKKRRRCITLLRWDTAYPRLVDEDKVRNDEADKVVFVKPYPFKRISRAYIAGKSHHIDSPLVNIPGMGQEKKVAVVGKSYQGEGENPTI